MSQTSERNHLAGSIWMVVAGVLFVAVTITVRHLGSDLPAVEAAFIRYSFGLLLLLPVIIKMRWRQLTRQSMTLYSLRGLAHGIAVMLWFYAMARIPIAEVTAIGYTTPIFTTIGAVLIFRERIQVRRILAIFIGFIGTVIILRPGYVSIELGSIAQLIAAPLFAVSFLFTKKLTRTEDSRDILVMLSIFCTLVLLPGAILQWRSPTATELMWLMLVAALATAGHYALTMSFAKAPLTVTQPYAFLQLVWAIIFGYLLFGEVPDVWVCLGGAIIVGSVTYMTHREAVVAREEKLKSASAVPL